MKPAIKQLLSAVIADNNQYIKDYPGGNIKDYLVADLDAQGDNGFFWYLTDEEITAWESSEAERERLSQEVMDLIFEYDYLIDEEKN